MMKEISKVAEITLLFWILKIIATTLGETFGDFISMTLNLGYMTGIGITFAFFIIALLTQLNVKQYIPSIYWIVIVATTTLGTEISDFIDRTLHLGYAWGSLLLLSCLFSSLFLWKKRYKNLEVYPITNKTKETYYWITILFSNSLGTAFGDFLSDNLGLAYSSGAIITSAIILIVVLLHYFTKINHILLFWIAFIFTRPFGATFGDFLTKPIEKGGLNLDRLLASLVCIAIMVVLLLAAHRQNKRKQVKINR